MPSEDSATPWEQCVGLRGCCRVALDGQLTGSVWPVNTLGLGHSFFLKLFQHLVGRVIHVSGFLFFFFFFKSEYLATLGLPLSGHIWQERVVVAASSGTQFPPGPRHSLRHLYKL